MEIKNSVNVSKYFNLKRNKLQNVEENGIVT